MNAKDDPDSVYHLQQARDHLVEANANISVPIFSLNADFAEEQKAHNVQGSAVSLTERRLTAAMEANLAIKRAVKLIDTILEL